METTARVGWLARSVLYLIVALLVSRIPLAGGGPQADRSGAFETIADAPFGRWLLGAVVVGLVAFAVWRLWAAAREKDEKPTRRLGWVGSAVVHLGAAILGLSVLVGRHGNNQNGQEFTARVLTWPGGRFLVGAIGLAAVGVAANAVRKGIKERFTRDIDMGEVPPRLRPVVIVIGLAGWLGRALVWALIGWFLIRAAVQHDPHEPVGLDQSLRTLAGAGWGKALIWVVVAGLSAFGLLCLATGLWPDPDPEGD
jgi:hypothetical protein